MGKLCKQYVINMSVLWKNYMWKQINHNTCKEQCKNKWLTNQGIMNHFKSNLGEIRFMKFCIRIQTLCKRHMTYESCKESCDKWFMNHVENCVKKKKSIQESCRESSDNVIV